MFVMTNVLFVQFHASNTTYDREYYFKDMHKKFPGNIYFNV